MSTTDHAIRLTREEMELAELAMLFIAKTTHEAGRREIAHGVAAKIRATLRTPETGQG